MYKYNIDGIEIVLKQPIYQATMLKCNRHNYKEIARMCQLRHATTATGVTATEALRLDLYLKKIKNRRKK